MAVKFNRFRDWLGWKIANTALYITTPHYRKLLDTAIRRGLTYPATVIDADEFEEAKRDPRVQALHREAEEYARELVERGHCPHHLVMNCGCKDKK